MKRKTKKQLEEESKNQGVLAKKDTGLFSYLRKAISNFLQDIKTTLIQIFQQPAKNEVDKDILKELQKLRKQLKRAARVDASSINDLSSSSESDSEKASEQLGVNHGDFLNNGTASDALQIATNTVEPDEEMNVLDEDPNNPLWIRDPTLGDGDVSK